MTPPLEPPAPTGPPAPPESPAPSSPLLLHVVRGEPTPEELAALVAVVAARAASASAGTTVKEPRRWGSRAAALRRPLPPAGPAAWPTSQLPGAW